MTTTLRPSGPEETAADGGRIRAFDVRVNGRRAGVLRLAVSAPRAGGPEGRITHLEIDEADRRRGRATVAALAAEELLRAEGCREVTASVPATAGGALALAASLGYTERGRILAKRLPDRPPPLAPGHVVRAVTDAEYPAWLAAERARSTRVLIDLGLPPEAAAERAEASCARLLPRGPATEGAALRVLAHDGVDVGTLWLSTARDAIPDPADAYVFSAFVYEGHRGRGHGRALMREAERLTRAAGGELLKLNVFTDNTPALRLYASLGYAVGTQHLYKSLG
ncbi:GNAT family N-acetyltransferase [Streptomyces litchfieldiae]|uniref:GNAT family N-acetyltransferase n=1 Tax=Streptomyces litchfieldiae TaxID=3075543 RepID=A0ABU2MVH8_9ACTN|nr:GNAT family N-acetyltransferase [Streptomyces sp. DSM 44938]MDT0345585.1 GNAT family N-acetyltransferase [Streptomyces sp. DSM 44938]